MTTHAIIGLAIAALAGVGATTPAGVQYPSPDGRTVATVVSAAGPKAAESEVYDYQGAAAAARSAPPSQAPASFTQTSRVELSSLTGSARPA